MRFGRAHYSTHLRLASRYDRADPSGIRDRALLLVGLAGAFRHSELVALTAEDVQFTSDGLVVTLQPSKTQR